VSKLVSAIGVDESKLKAMMNTGITDANINEFGRFDALKATVDKAKAKAYFEALENTSISVLKVNIKVDTLLQSFVISGGFDLSEPSGSSV
jgi:type I restriction enzyme R subunit